MIGRYATPKVRLPGSGGATEIATSCGRIYIVMRHGPRSFVETLDFVTSLGHGPTGRERRDMGLTTEGPVLLVSDLCVMKPHAETKEFEVVSLHPGVSARSGARRDRLAGQVCRRRHRDAGADGRGARDAARPERTHRAGARHGGRRMNVDDVIGTQPTLLYPLYKSTILRAPQLVR